MYTMYLCMYVCMYVLMPLLRPELYLWISTWWLHKYAAFPFPAAELLTMPLIQYLYDAISIFFFITSFAPCDILTFIGYCYRMDGLHCTGPPSTAIRPSYPSYWSGGRTSRLRTTCAIDIVVFPPNFLSLPVIFLFAFLTFTHSWLL